MPIIAAIIGIIRAIRAAIKKVTFRLVRLKTRPIKRGPMVIPKGVMVPCMAMKPARCSKGATPAAMKRWLAKFIPWATPKRIVGNKHNHKVDNTGIIAMAKA